MNLKRNTFFGSMAGAVRAMLMVVLGLCLANILVGGDQLRLSLYGVIVSGALLLARGLSRRDIEAPVSARRQDLPLNTPQTRFALEGVVPWAVLGSVALVGLMLVPTVLGGMGGFVSGLMNSLTHLLQLLLLVAVVVGIAYLLLTRGRKGVASKPIMSAGDRGSPVSLETKYISENPAQSSITKPLK